MFLVSRNGNEIITWIWNKLLADLCYSECGTRVSGVFFKAVVQAVMIFGDETWLVTPRIVRALGGFRHRVA